MLENDSEPLSGRTATSDSVGWLTAGLIVEALPIAVTVLCGLGAGLTGIVFFDWITGLVFVGVGAAAGFVAGLLVQFIGTVLLIGLATAKESFVARNHVPLVFGAICALYGAVPLVINGGAIDIASAIVVALVFTLGAGFGLVAQGIWRRARRLWSLVRSAVD